MQRRLGDSLYLGRRRALTRTANGHLMIVPTIDLSLGPWLIANGTWEEAISAIVQRALRPGMTVVDVGANVGWYTLLAAKAVGPKGRVIAFEPDPEIAEMLRDNVELNGYDERVRVIVAAAADRTGTERFHATRKHRGNGSLVPELNQLGDASAEIETIDVAVTTIDAEGIDRIDVLKVDAEGSEARVFRGARATLERSRHLTAIVEFWPIFFTRAGEDPAAFIHERLREGFRLHQIDKQRAKVVRAQPRDVLARGVYELVLRR